MKGLIISADRDNAENIKLIVENQKADFEMDILDPGEKSLCLIDSNDYDFVLYSVKPLMAQEIMTQLKPFCKTVLNRTTDYIGLYRNQKITYIDRNKIIGIEIMERTCFIYTKKSVHKITRSTLNNILEKLEDSNIVRCHKSYAVNIKYVKSFRRETSNRWIVEFIVDTNFDCRMSERYIKQVIERYEEYHDVKLSKTIELC